MRLIRCLFTWKWSSGVGSVRPLSTETTLESASITVSILLEMALSTSISGPIKLSRIPWPKPPNPPPAPRIFTSTPGDLSSWRRFAENLLVLISRCSSGTKFTVICPTLVLLVMRCHQLYVITVSISYYSLIAHMHTFILQYDTSRHHF